MYSYSKRLLAEYMRCLPDGTDDVINVETDSMYYDRKHQAAFIENVAALAETSEYPVCIGEGVNAPLGCVKQEYNTEEPSFFLGKKFYTIAGSMRIKGIPLNTVDKHGNRVPLVTLKLYADVYSGKTVKRSFSTMKKNLFGTTYISQHVMSRTISPAMEYSLYV